MFYDIPELRTLFMVESNVDAIALRRLRDSVTPQRARYRQRNWRAQRLGVLAALANAFLAAYACLTGCAYSGPFRNASAQFVGQQNGDATCISLFKDSDSKIRGLANLVDVARNRQLQAISSRIKAQQQEQRTGNCWRSAYERHDDYDVYYAEFDDAGQAADVARNPTHPFENTELYLIEKSILTALNQDPNAGLNIVVFTHGWHGNAGAEDSYSIEFKAVLESIYEREQLYVNAAATAPGAPGAPARPRHTVLGIEVAWRGDSLKTGLSLLDDTNVWDRKSAAEVLSTGAVQELFAFLNQVYQDNSCHTAADGSGSVSLSAPAAHPVAVNNAARMHARCNRVHLLSIGHSFGALINFRALTPRLESGLNVDACNRVYGFGDMTILLNPAFEGARYRALFKNAQNRPRLMGPYYGDTAGPADYVEKQFGNTCGWPADPERRKVQIPSIVTLQSTGDWATGKVFPLFRHATTAFAKTLSEEEVVDKNRAIGWVPDFLTHKLTLLPNPSNDSGATGDQCVGDATSYCPFPPNGKIAPVSDTAPGTALHPVQLSWAPQIQSGALPNYMPLWAVAVAPQIMKDHDDFWNPEVVRLISLLFFDAYEQTERSTDPGQLVAQSTPPANP
jgi:hypothetical protein